MGIKESSIEEYLFNLVTVAHGGECIKLTGNKGIPDRLVLLPYGRIFFIELKKPSGGVFSEAQDWWHSKIRKLGSVCYQAKSKEEVEEILNNEYLEGIVRHSI